MIKRGKKAIGTCLVGVMTVLSVGGAVSMKEVTTTEAATTEVQNAYNKIEQLRTSVRKNSLTLSNVAQWQTYISEAKSLTNKLPNGSTKNLYNSRINSAERLVNAVAAVSQLEKSMSSNSHVIKNVPTWINYVDVAVDKLARVTVEYDEQFYNLYKRLLMCSLEIDKIIEKNDSTVMKATVTEEIKNDRSLSSLAK